ncbi:hypothetical protein MJO29_017074 [Puccinia striiformis f. sp. tritici]|nr:hypothetical protein MJO29_017074 [Puccinia striiformis f. sp. tritici]
MDQADIFFFFQEWQLGDLKTTENMNLDEEMEKIKTHLKSFDTLTQREKLDKIYEILDNNPHSLGKRENSAEEPTQQNKKLKIQPTSTPFIPSSKSSASITILPTKEELPSKSNWTSEAHAQAQAKDWEKKYASCIELNPLHPKNPKKTNKTNKTNKKYLQ